MFGGGATEGGEDDEYKEATEYYAFGSGSRRWLVPDSCLLAVIGFFFKGVINGG